MHIWQARILDYSSSLPFLHANLSAEERLREKRYLLQSDRHQFLVGRGLLRLILARYLRVEPGSLRFEKGPHGKPKIVGEPRLQFNISYAKDLVLYAFTWENRVGIDIEKIDLTIDVGSLARRLLSSRESVQFSTLEGLDRYRAFFRCWTCKEAVVKAIEEGLRREFNTLEIDLLSQSPVMPCHVQATSGEAFTGELHALAVADGYAATVCVEGDARDLTCVYAGHESGSREPNSVR